MEKSSVLRGEPLLKSTSIDCGFESGSDRQKLELLSRVSLRDKLLLFMLSIMILKDLFDYFYLNNYDDERKYERNDGE